MGVISEKKSWLQRSNSAFSHIIVFGKAQLSAFVGGITDYGIMVFCTEVFHVHYTVSIVIGGIIGAVVNFSINKKWAFNSKNDHYQHSMRKQLLKFLLVVVNSIFLKSIGTFAITTMLSLDYKISRLVTDLFVSIGFNYTLQRYWVFKKA
ncbi:MAG TPA: GtrA family protein [Paludibacter sp.]|nr:GtrA family protein [Paludibacter sp.]